MRDKVTAVILVFLGAFGLGLFIVLSIRFFARLVSGGASA